MKWAKGLWILAVLALVACSDAAKKTNDPTVILSEFELQLDRDSMTPQLADSGLPVGVLLAIPPVGPVTMCSIGNFGTVALSNAHCVEEALTKNPNNFYVLYLDKNTAEKRVARVTSLVPGNQRTDDLMVVHLDGTQIERWASLNVAVDPFVQDTSAANYFLLAFDPVPSSIRPIGSPDAYGIRGSGAVFSRKRCAAVKRGGFEIADGPDGRNRRFYQDSKKDLTYPHTVVMDNILPTTVSGDSGGILIDEKGDAVAVFKWHLFRSAFTRNQYYLTNRGEWHHVRSGGRPWYSVVGVATDISAATLPN